MDLLWLICDPVEGAGFHAEDIGKLQEISLIFAWSGEERGCNVYRRTKLLIWPRLIVSKELPFIILNDWLLLVRKIILKVFFF